MQCIMRKSYTMSFDFSSNSINQFKTQSTYKDGGGMGGGGMYFEQQKKKRDEEQEKDIFTASHEDKKSEEIIFDDEIPENEIPQDTIINKFVNWFRIKK